MNKGGYARLVIGGISIGAIILLAFRLWATGLVIDKMEPELEKALNQLDEKIVCIPEASSPNHEVCIGGLREIIVNGNIEKSLIIKTDSGDFCNINAGHYEHITLCTLKNLEKAKQIYIEGSDFNKKVIETTQIISYINNLQNLKKPIKTGFLIFRKIKYIPI